MDGWRFGDVKLQGWTHLLQNYNAHDTEGPHMLIVSFSSLFWNLKLILKFSRDCFIDLDDDFLTGSLSIQIDGSGNQRLILNNGVCSDRNLAEDQTFAYNTVSQLGKLLII